MIAPTQFPFVEETLERAFWGLELQPGLEIAAAHARPATVRHLGRGNPWSIPAVFPAAAVVPARLDAAGTAELVIAHFALRHADLDAEAAVDQLRDHVDDGGHVLVVDLHAVPVDALRRRAESALGVDVRAPLLAELSRRVVPLHRAVQQHFAGAWSTFVFVGRRGVPRR